MELLRRISAFLYRWAFYFSSGVSFSLCRGFLYNLYTFVDIYLVFFVFLKSSCSVYQPFYPAGLYVHYTVNSSHTSGVMDPFDFTHQPFLCIWRSGVNLINHLFIAGVRMFITGPLAWLISHCSLC